MDSKKTRKKFVVRLTDEAIRARLEANGGIHVSQANINAVRKFLESRMSNPRGKKVRVLIPGDYD